MTTKILFFIS